MLGHDGGQNVIPGWVCVGAGGEVFNRDETWSLIDNKCEQIQRVKLILPLYSDFLVFHLTGSMIQLNASSIAIIVFDGY